MAHTNKRERKDDRPRKDKHREHRNDRHHTRNELRDYARTNK